MRINELIESNNQLDELNLRGMGQGVANAVGKTTNALGAVAGGAAGAWDAAKAGFQTGRQAVGGQFTKQQTPNQPAGTTPPAANANTTTPQAGTPAAQPGTTPPASGQTATPTAQPGTAPATTPANAPTATAPTQGKVGVPAGKQAVDQAVATVKTVRGDRRPQVVAYGKQQFDALAQQPAAAPAQPTTPPEEENPNIVKGYNEDLTRLLHLAKSKQ